MSNYNTQLQSNNTDLQEVLEALKTKAAGGGEQATPVISVNSNGLITATAGTKSSTHQLAFQAAKTITPSTVDQVAVSSGYYTGGVVTVKGDSNLVASNIVSGKTIFGVTGTATAGSGDDTLPFTYTVEAISGATYGFAKNSNGYYESQNKGKDSSYAICRVNFNVTKSCDIVFDVINYAESSFDYAVFGNLDSALALSNSSDSNAKQNFKGQQSAFVVNVTYGDVSTGNHFIDIKFIKDGSTSSNNDSVQFKVQEQGAGGSGGTDMEDGLVDGTITNYTNDRVKTIGKYAFYAYDNLIAVNFPEVTNIGSNAFGYCMDLTTISFPKVTTISSYAFYGCTSLKTASFPAATTIHYSAFGRCTNLTTVSFPVATTISHYAFYGCSNLTTASFPAATTIGNYAFTDCTNLKTARFPAASTIGEYAFNDCYNLKSLYLTGSSVCRLNSVTAFGSTPIDYYSTSAGTYGSIYVPASLLTAYKTANNWSRFSSRFVGI